MDLVRASVEPPGNNDVVIAAAGYVRDPGVRIIEYGGSLPAIKMHRLYALSVGNEQLAIGRPGDGLHILSLRQGLDGSISLNSGAGKQAKTVRGSYLYGGGGLAIGGKG